jgi:hypothetical protein
MEKKSKHCIRIFGVWQEENEMKWLKQMSQKGWHFKKACIFLYTFEKGEPTDIVYYADFKYLKKTDTEEYIGMYSDAGWKFICSQGSWFYFSSPADNKYKEVYTDNQSRLIKYRRLLLIHVILITILMNSLRIIANRISDNATIIMEILLFLVFVIFLILIYSTIRLIGVVGKLNKSIKE